MGESSDNYIEILRAAAENKLSFINQNVLDIIVGSIDEYRKTFEALLNTLINSGLLVKDIYADCTPAFELKLPSSAPVKPADKRTELGIRLSDYLKQLVYLEDYYEFSLDFLTPERVRSLRNFFSFINWQGMSPNSVSPNDRLLAEIEKELSDKEDSLCRSVFRDAKQHLSELTEVILNGLEDTAIYLRESFKLEVREIVIPFVAAEADTFIRQPDEAVLSIKKEFRKRMGEIPFYTEFIKEIISEDFGGASAERQKTALERLTRNRTAIFDSEPEEPSASDDNSLLLEGFRLLGSAGPALINIAEKLNDNADIIENRKPGLLQRILFFFNRKLSTERSLRIYNVIILDPRDETGKSVKINFNKYIGQITGRGRTLIGYRNKTGSALLELRRKDSAELADELAGNIKFLYACTRLLPAIELYLRDRATNAMRCSMKGIKLDLNDIQSCIIKANRRRLEYRMQLPGGF